MAAGPPIVAPLVALLAWRRKEMILGNVAGTLVIFGTAMALILRESFVLDRLVRQCSSCPSGTQTTAATSGCAGS